MFGSKRITKLEAQNEALKDFVHTLLKAIIETDDRLDEGDVRAARAQLAPILEAIEIEAEILHEHRQACS